MTEGIRVDVDELLRQRENDLRVRIDNEKAALIDERQRCERCEGTGNQMMFMYQQCEMCGGSGFAPDVVSY